VTNFAAIATDLLNAGGLVQTTSDRLPDELKNLIAETDRSKRLVQDGRKFIRTRQGATARHATILRELAESGASR
jgi:3-deoxy-D-manno-octulosonic-acid transferase